MGRFSVFTKNCLMDFFVFIMDVVNDLGGGWAISTILPYYPRVLLIGSTNAFLRDRPSSSSYHRIQPSNPSTLTFVKIPINTFPSLHIFTTSHSTQESFIFTAKCSSGWGGQGLVCVQLQQIRFLWISCKKLMCNHVKPSSLNRYTSLKSSRAAVYCLSGLYTKFFRFWTRSSLDTFRCLYR